MRDHLRDTQYDLEEANRRAYRAKRQLDELQARRSRSRRRRSSSSIEAGSGKGPPVRRVAATIIKYVPRGGAGMKLSRHRGESGVASAPYPPPPYEPPAAPPAEPAATRASPDSHSSASTPYALWMTKTMARPVEDARRRSRPKLGRLSGPKARAATATSPAGRILTKRGITSGPGHPPNGGNSAGCTRAHRGLARSSPSTRR